MEIQEEKKEMGTEEKVEEDHFNKLPEGCISGILSLTTPRDVCRFSLLSSAFNSAAESDALWETLLPSDYREIIARSISVPLFSSKKELYFNLCDNPLLIDGGNKSFALEKRSGKKCIMLGARDLSIIWGSTPRYWKWRAFDGSRFAEVAELLDVCWLEINGQLDTRLLSPKTLYAAYFVLNFAEETFGFPHPLPAHTLVHVVGGSSSGSSGERSFYWDSDDREMNQMLVPPYHIEGQDLPHDIDGMFPQERGDGWKEIEMGYFFNDGEDAGEVQMRLTDLTGHWKTGLIVEGIELRPKVNE